MADATIGKTDVSAYIPQIIASMTLEKITGNQIFSNLAYVNYSDDLKSKGDTIKIPGIGKFDVMDKVENTATVKQDMLATDISLTLDKHKYVKFLIEDVSMASASQDVMKRFSDSASRAILGQVEKDFADALDDAYITGTGTITVTNTSAAVVGVATIFTDLQVGDILKTAGSVEREITVITDDTHLTVSANYTATETTVAFSYMQQSVYANGSDIDDAAIRKARKRIRKESEADNIVLVSTLDDYDIILGLTTFTSADSINKKLLQNGEVGNIRGFKTFEHNRFNKSFSAAFCPNGLAAAFRVLPAAKGVYSSGVLVDEVTGLAIRYTVKYDTDYMGYVYQIDLIYGMKVIEPEKFTRIAEAVV